MEKLKKKINLCIGLDTDVRKLPAFLPKDTFGMLEFNKKIIEATKDIADAYKINFAFYEKFGALGFEILEKTFEILPKNLLSIADAKRSDIGNTSKAYAEAIFEHFKADSVTVNPYMGFDSIEPFLSYDKKIIFILLLTSNPGSKDFQRINVDNKPLYLKVLERTKKWKTQAKMGYVVGATHPEELKEIQEVSPESIFLIPGVGTQGGSIYYTIKAIKDSSAILNVSRDIIFASDREDFAEKARQKALYYKNKILESL